MSEKRVMTKSKIPLRATSSIPVRIDVNKKSATLSHKITTSRNKPASAEQGVTSKEKGVKVSRPAETSTNKTSKATQPNQVKNKINKTSLKETDRNEQKAYNPSRTLSKSYKTVKASTPVPLVRTKIKVQPTKSKSRVQSHPSQPDIEFVPDEVSRKRILGCIDLPSAPNAMSRGQTSIYDRPSLYQINTMVRPTDPCKALKRTLESLKLKGRRETVQSSNWRESISQNRPSVNKIGLKPPDFAVLKTLDNNDYDRSSLKQSGMQATFWNNGIHLMRKTPQMVLEEAKKRFEAQKLKEENKSVKKVTFKVSNSALGKENECLVETKPSNVEQEKPISESSTPPLKPRKIFFKEDETPSPPPAPKLPSKDDQAAGVPSSNLVKKPVSILKNRLQIFPELDTRRGSLFSTRPTRNGLGKMRRSISFSNFPLASLKGSSPGSSSNCFGSRVQAHSFNPVDDSKTAGQHQSSPVLCRRSISSPEFSALYPSIAAPRSELRASPALRSALKKESDRINDLVDRIRSSVSASGLRGSLFLTSNLRDVPQSKKPTLCTPVPVSLFPKSRAADSFSPEFLCPRTSNYIADAPILTPLVLRNLAEREANDDLNQVRQKLVFMPPAEEVPQQKGLTQVTKQNLLDCLADQECCGILCGALFPYICSQSILNPIAKTLENGDEMHFVPVSLCP